MERRLGLLSDFEIEQLCQKGPKHKPMIHPYLAKKVRTVNIADPEEPYVKKACSSFGQSHCGYDIRLSGEDFRLFVGTSLDVLDPEEVDEKASSPFKQVFPDYKNRILMPPHSFGLAVSLEKFTMPEDVFGLCVGKSTLNRYGITVPLTPIEPGWRGYLTLEISNHGPVTAALHVGQGITQVIFFRVPKPKTTYEGKYQDQQNRVHFATR